MRIDEPEEWRVIKDYPKYEVSNYGNVRNRKNGKLKTPRRGRNKNYLSVYLRNENGDNTRPIHRLVAENFVEGENKICVNHKDGNKLNNYYKNLEWCTFRDNNIHAIKNNLNHPGAYQLRKVKVIETGEIYNGVVECAKNVGSCFQNVYAALNHKRKTANGFHFEYVE